MPPACAKYTAASSSARGPGSACSAASTDAVPSAGSSRRTLPSGASPEPWFVQ
ncbi:hypothetical protein WMF30_54595 [Sorangium sp. So ce134]